DIPLVNVVNPNSPIGETTSSPSVSLPVVSAEKSFPNQSSQDIPLVNQLSPSKFTDPLIDLVKKNNTISPVIDSLNSTINIQNYTSNLNTPIQPKLRNTLVVYSRAKKPKSADNEQILLFEQLQTKKPSVVAENAEDSHQTTSVNDKLDLPIVKVNSESYLPELEPLIWSNYPIAKEKVNNLNSEQIAHQKNLISKDNHSTSSHQSPNHISNIIPVNETTNISYSSVNSHPPPINQSQKTSLEGVSIPPQINVDDLVEKVERRIMRRLVIESERRGKRKWR
ncbi:hypothetical protein, partial [Anabaenopsis arnoldii]